MKKMTCRQLGGACDLVFEASTFEEMAKLSRIHAMEFFQKGDQPHVDAVNRMKDMMMAPKALQVWMDERKREFDNL